MNRGVKRVEYKVKALPDKYLEDQGYMGMNHYAARDFGYKPLPSKNVVFVDKGLKGRERTVTVNHEVIEAEQMRKGMKYWPAHKIATKRESDFL